MRFFRCLWSDRIGRLRFAVIVSILAAIVALTLTEYGCNIGGGESPSSIVSTLTAPPVPTAPHRAGGLPGTAEKIYFSSNRDGRFDLFSINLDGTGLINLTHYPKQDRRASVSVDGTRIVFVSNREEGFELYSMTPAGTDVRRLTDDKGSSDEPALSPDGARIVYTNRNDLWLMSFGGGAKIRITSGCGADRCPSWSPDGTRIAFRRKNEIWLVNPDGSNAHRLTKNKKVEKDPRFSPVSNKIVFVRGDDLWEVDADTAAERLIADASRGRAKEPCYSPDGARIVYAANGTSGGWTLGRSGSTAQTGSNSRPTGRTIASRSGPSRRAAWSTIRRQSP